MKTKKAKTKLAGLPHRRDLAIKAAHWIDKINEAGMSTYGRITAKVPAHDYGVHAAGNVVFATLEGVLGMVVDSIGNAWAATNLNAEERAAALDTVRDGVEGMTAAGATVTPLQRVMVHAQCLLAAVQDCRTKGPLHDPLP